MIVLMLLLTNFYVFAENLHSILDKFSVQRPIQVHVCLCGFLPISGVTKTYLDSPQTIQAQFFNWIRALFCEENLVS